MATMLLPTTKRQHQPTSCCTQQPAFKKRKTTTKFIMSALPDRLKPDRNNKTCSISPQQFLLSLLASQGIEANFVSYKALNDFFSDPTDDEIHWYRSDVLNAVRTRDISTLRSFLEQGRPLKCSNQFGESLLHLACRRGFLDVVKFLVEEANVPLRIRDDYGRTPLHDALWTTEPNVELVDYIISICPDLLYIKDRRENTPLSFVRKNDFAIWVTFLKNLPVGKLLPTHITTAKQSLYNPNTQ